MAETLGFEIDFNDFDFEFSSGDGVNQGSYAQLGEGFEIDFNDFDFEFSSGDGVNQGSYAQLGEGFEIDFNDFDFEFSGDSQPITNIEDRRCGIGIGFVINITCKFYDYADTMFEILLDEDKGLQKRMKLIPIM